MFFVHTDECSDGGALYKRGESWTCSDGTNMCQCAGGKKVFSSKVGSHYTIMCDLKVQDKLPSNQQPKSIGGVLP